MAKEYISREAAIIGLAASSLMPHQIDDAAEALKLVPAADVVARDCYDMILEENDALPCDKIRRLVQKEKSDG